MPANRMKAAVASTLKVIGSNSAMVSAGPRPGSTPMAVPSVVPSRHHIRFTGVIAVAKPVASWPRVSMSSAPEPDELLEITGPDIDAEERRKAEIGDQRHREPDGGVAHNLAVAEAVGDQHEHACGRENEAERDDQRDVEDEAGRHEAERMPVNGNVLLFLGLPTTARGLHQHENCKQR